MTLAQAPLARNHEHGLPREIDWRAVRLRVLAVAALMTYPPEQVAFVGPDGDMRGFYRGDERSVSIPFQELGRLYQAVCIHQHPPGAPPTLADISFVARAACPLLVTLEGDDAHLVWVWSTHPPGLIGEVISQFDDLAQALRHVHGVWQVVPRDALGTALVELAERWYAFLADLDITPERIALPAPDEPVPTLHIATVRRSAEPDPETGRAGTSRRGVSHMLQRHLNRLRNEAQFAFRMAGDSAVELVLNARVRTFPSREAAWAWLKRAEHVGLERLFREG